MGIAGATALASKKMSRPQTLSALNLAALMVHQYEEYDGLAPVLFGFMQAVGHGVIFPCLVKARYSPGFLGLPVSSRTHRHRIYPRAEGRGSAGGF